MSNRNNNDYFDLNNFDDSYDSNQYRRRQVQRRQGSYNRRPTYNSQGRRQYKRRTRNRIIIISAAVVIVAVLITLIVLMFKACGTDNKKSISTDTIEQQNKVTSTVAATTASDAPEQSNDVLSASYFETPQIDDDNSKGTQYYNIYAWNKAGYELFGGTESSAEKYATTVNGFAKKFSGVTVYDMVIPNHTEMGLPQRLKDSDAPSTSQADNIKTIYAGLDKSVTAINAYNYLSEHNKEYIYFKSDHHWTGLGAYYAYKAFADTKKLPALSLDDCTEATIEGFTGTFMKTAPNVLDTDTVHYWKFPYDVTLDITDTNGNVNTYDSPYYSAAAGGDYTYGVFLMGDNPLSVLKSSSDKAQDKKIAVVKESYGNAFAPYLTYNYKEVHVIDFRTFGKNLPQYCKENGIDEVLFLNGIMSANTQIQLDSMSTLFN